MLFVKQLPVGGTDVNICIEKYNINDKYLLKPSFCLPGTEHWKQGSYSALSHIYICDYESLSSRQNPDQSSLERVHIKVTHYFDNVITLFLPGQIYFMGYTLARSPVNKILIYI